MLPRLFSGPLVFMIFGLDSSWHYAPGWDPASVLCGAKRIVGIDPTVQREINKTGGREKMTLRRISLCSLQPKPRELCPTFVFHFNHFNIICYIDKLLLMTHLDIFECPNFPWGSILYYYCIILLDNNNKCVALFYEMSIPE